jgi:hypothetical protein
MRRARGRRPELGACGCRVPYLALYTPRRFNSDPGGRPREDILRWFDLQHRGFADGGDSYFGPGANIA